MQKTFIAGNVGKDAVLRRLQDGTPVLSFTVAVNNGKDKQGAERPPTWWDCSLWDKRAESLEAYIKKGTKLSLMGRPSARSHEGKPYLGLSVDELTFQGGGSQQSDQQSGGGYQSDDDDSQIPF